jgi:phosphorylcholine metabolism protein LicD
MIERKKKPCKGCNKETYIFSRGNCETCSKKLKKAKDKEIKPKKKAKTISQLKKELDTVFSQYVRLYYSDENGIAECYTCGVKKPFSQLQNGHFFSRSNLSTRFLLINCRVQCAGCNVFRHGNYIVYTQKMIAELGEEKFRKLEKLSKASISMSTDEYLYWIEDYKKQVKELLQIKTN